MARGILKGLALFVILLAHSKQVWADDHIEQEFCRQALKKPVLHTDQNAQARIVEILHDEFGPYFKLNVKSPRPEAQEIFEQLGFRGFNEKLVMPLPSTMNARMLVFRPRSPLRFRSSEGSRIPLVTYMRALSQNILLISLEGQFYHDMMDHAVGYLILSETDYWPHLVQKLQTLLTEYDEASSYERKIQVRQKILRISNWLEAASQGALTAYDEGPEELNSFAELLIGQLNRLN